MFETALRLIVHYGYPLCEWNAEQAQDTLAAHLHTAMHVAFPYRRKEIMRITERFVLSSAWSMVWARLRHEWVPSERLSDDKLADIEQSLREHFSTIEEMEHV